MDEKMMDDFAARFATAEEAAQIIGVSSRRVRKLVEEGRIVGGPVGKLGMVMISRASIEFFMRTPRLKPGRKPAADAGPPKLKKKGKAPK